MSASQPVTVADLRGSCGCGTLLLAKDGVQTKNVTLASGDKADIHLWIRLNSDASGPVRKYVWAYGPPAAGQGTPLVTIALDMMLEKSVSFEPASVDFGTVTAGHGASRPLPVTAAQTWSPGRTCRRWSA